MKILITGAKGFIGKNLSAELRNRQYNDVLEFNRDTNPSLLEDYTRNCDFVYHLAGVNRPEHPEEFMQGNFSFTRELIRDLRMHHNTCPVLFASSIQAELSNPYGESKKAAEDALLEYGRESGAKVLVYRFQNVFGKWCRPNYNSAVATFCYNSARGMPVRVDNSNTLVSLIYIDDVIEELLRALNGKENRYGDFCAVPTVYSKKLGEIVDAVYRFRAYRETIGVPNLADDFERKLYSTYLSYLPPDTLSYPLKMNTDNRGSFAEIIRTADRGQFSVSITKPGITRGNHWHHSKNEKFLVVSGKGIIGLQQVGSTESIQFLVSGDKMEVIQIPPGYVHYIQNVGEDSLVTFIWANEPFDTERPDTYPR